MDIVSQNVEQLVLFVQLTEQLYIAKNNEHMKMHWGNANFSMDIYVSCLEREPQSAYENA